MTWTEYTKKKQKKLRKRIALMIAFLCCIVFLSPRWVNADGEEIEFGSESYTYESGQVFPVGIYLKFPTEPSDYRIVITYDTMRMRYLSGASSIDGGTLILDGAEAEEYEDGYRYWLQFEALSGGEAYIEVMLQEFYYENGEVSVPNMHPYASIYLDGEDTAVYVDPRKNVGPSEQAEEENTTEINDDTTEEVSSEESDSPTTEDVTVEGDEDGSWNKILPIVLIFLLFIACVVMAIVNVRILRSRKKKNAKKTAFIPTIFMDDKEKKENDPEKPVIRLKNITMIFNVATDNVSGLKEYIIQKVRRKLSYRKFYALNQISFDVHKGEVLGIIGTNGSGKSTLLKIVSGALRPTEGKVFVDKRKVQLLTLGTGFDMELTAKENVYLNGAIIGYSKEFIDRHYDEIVEFAELQGFMQEKVKNFSSGMVSRLGFAIATAGSAAEILILDEVLSVGDEFFRKKSLERIKELIHGGSTVLLVSHSMQTIMEHCSRAIWIEKGVLMADGVPKEVCKAYVESGKA